MRKKYYNVAKIKHEVYAARKRKKGKKYVLKPLSESEREELKNLFVVEPWLYKVRIDFPYGFTITESTSSIIKQLYFYRKQTGNRFRYLHLTEQQLEKCKDAGIDVKLIKYKIC